MINLLTKDIKIIEFVFPNTWTNFILSNVGLEDKSDLHIVFYPIYENKVYWTFNNWIE